MNLNYYQQIRSYLTTERKPFFLVAKKYIDENSRILDVGAGDGSFAETIQRPDTYLLEGNGVSFKYLTEKFPNVKQGTLPCLPYENAFFNLIHCSHIVEHLPPQQLYDFLSEVDRCLKPGGHLIVSAPLLTNVFYDDLSHVKPYTPMIFIKYLALGNPRCATRELISSDYNLREQVFRYNYKDEDYINFYEKTSLLYRPIIFMHKLGLKLRKSLGIVKIQRTGFTIVLQKK